MDTQSKFEEFLNSETQTATGFPIPKLTIPLAQKIIARIDRLKWYLNRYSLELNFQHDNLELKKFFELAREWGFDGIQIHVARGGPRISLAGESDSYLSALAKQINTRKIDIQIDISSVKRDDLEDAVRVARAMKVQVIRCYARHNGTISEIISGTIEQLKYASELADKWNLIFLLEQHELLTGNEMVEILESVNSDRLGILFDFGNPVSTGINPLEDLYIMRDFIKVAHCKDVMIISKDGMPTQFGVKFGQGDLNLPKIIFDLLMLGEKNTQLDVLSIQEVVGYLGVSLRSQSEPADKVYAKRPASKTHLHNNISTEQLDRRMIRERRDVVDALSWARHLASQLKQLALEFLHEELQGPKFELGPEATLVRDVEKIGCKLFGETVYKQIWEFSTLSEAEWDTMGCPGMDHAGAIELLGKAQKIKDELFGR